MKKEFFYRTVLNSIDKGRRDPRRVKKVVALTLVCGLFFMVSFGFLLYYAVGMAKDLVAGKPDLDLLAMERLIAEKSLILSEAQQRLMAPIVKGLAVSGLAPEQAAALKAQLLGSISPAQLATMEAWKSAATSKAAALFVMPPAVAAIIENYTGLSKENVAARIDAFLAWWQLARPANSAEQLQKTMKSL